MCSGSAPFGTKKQPDRASGLLFVVLSVSLTDPTACYKHSVIYSDKLNAPDTVNRESKQAGRNALIPGARS